MNNIVNHLSEKEIGINNKDKKIKNFVINKCIENYFTKKAIKLKQTINQFEQNSALQIVDNLERVEHIRFRRYHISSDSVLNNID